MHILCPCLMTIQVYTLTITFHNDPRARDFQNFDLRHAEMKKKKKGGMLDELSKVKQPIH